MEKLQIKKLILISSLLFLFSCYFNNNLKKEKKLFIEKIRNFTEQITIEYYLVEKIKQTFLDYPGFTIVTDKNLADLICEIEIIEFDRIPIYLSKKEPYKVCGSKFEVKVKIILKNKNEIFNESMIEESFITSTGSIFKEENVMETLSERISKKVYKKIKELEI